jgi:hypothetical protein
MKVTPYFFFGSALIASILLVSFGAPIVPVLAGCLLAGLFTWLKFVRRAAHRR